MANTSSICFCFARGTFALLLFIRKFFNSQDTMCVSTFINYTFCLEKQIKDGYHKEAIKKHNVQ